MAELFDNDTEKIAYAERVIAHPPTGTINCLAVNEKGEVSGTTTTSGLAWKIPGRVGDSPIIGAGLYVDGDVGGAGSTGKGEENITECQEFFVAHFPPGIPGEQCDHEHSCERHVGRGGASEANDSGGGGRHQRAIQF